MIILVIRMEAKEMTDGVYVNGQRCQTKKALKEAAAQGRVISIECTSMFGGYDGDSKDAPVGKTFTVVGPDPYRSRKWYANIKRQEDGTIKVW